MSEICNHGRNLMTFSPLKPARMGSSACEYEFHIRHSWSLDALLHIGALCADAATSLSAPQQAELRERMGWSEKTYEDFISIGFHSGLQWNDVYPCLPPSLSVLALVAMLPWEQVEKAIREGVIHPHMHMRALTKWLEAQELAKRKKRRPKRSRSLSKGVANECVAGTQSKCAPHGHSMVSPNVP
jgi:hypothetical protein